jgi:hypothetical protein
MYDIDNISEGEGNGRESVTEPAQNHMTMSNGIWGQRISFGCQKISLGVFTFQIVMVVGNLTKKVRSCSTAEII